MWFGGGILNYLTDVSLQNSIDDNDDSKGGIRLFSKLTRDIRFSKQAISISDPHPRTFAVYFESASHSMFSGVEYLDPNAATDSEHNAGGVIGIPRDHPFEGFPETEEQRDFQRVGLKNSKKYTKAMPDPAETQECKLKYDWQKEYHPNCNLVLEQDITQIYERRPHHHHHHHHNHDDEKHHSHFHHPVKYLAAGYYRDVWRIVTALPENDDDGYDGRSVLKTLRYQHEYTTRNFERHRRDALTMEQLTKSPFIMDIYGFCANSGLFEFADGGSLEDSIFGNERVNGDWTAKEKLIIAHQAASGVAAVHNSNKEGVASIAHTDISPSQFVLVNNAGVYKLNDFNRARFILHDRKTDAACPFTVSNNKGKFRAPEEYRLPHVETEMVDVYSLGNILYIILVGTFPFDTVKDEEAQAMVLKGERPPIPTNIVKSKDPYLQLLLKAIVMCWVQDEHERYSARQVQDFLDDGLKKLGVHAKQDDEGIKSE